MKKIFISILVLICIQGQSFAKGGDAVANAMKAYEKMEYQNAISILEPALGSLPADRASLGNLSMGIILLKNAELHGAFYETATMAANEYLSDLVKKKKGRVSSRYASLYLAEVYLSEGKYKSAIKYFNEFLSSKNISNELREIAYTELGLAYYRINQKTKANEQWSKVKSTDPVVKSSLLVAKIQAGVKVDNKVSSLYQAYKKDVGKGKYISSRFTSNIIYLLVKGGKIDDGLDFVQSEIIDNASYNEKFKNDKQISFYDISILKNMTDLLQMASVHYLKLAAKDGKYGPTANYYLMEAGLVFSDKKLVKSASVELKKSNALPKSLDKMKLIKVSAGDYLSGNKSQGQTQLNQYFSRNSSDPGVMAEVILACVYTKAECDKLVNAATKISENSRGRKFVPLNIAIGRYLLSQNKADQALIYMERARDKSNKNKIGANDPILLVGLAEIYRREKAYWENLEIFFEMSRQFPIVRQIQEAVQGTYSTQQKSAGDVKIF